MPNPQKNQVTLTAEEREFLEKKTKSGGWSPREVQRGKILLLADVNGPGALPDDAIANRLDCSVRTIEHRRRRFIQVKNVEDAVVDKPRSGRPTIVDGTVEAHMTAIACSTPPEGRARWTLKLIRDRIVTLEVIDNISDRTVGRALKKKSLSPG